MFWGFIYMRESESCQFIPHGLFSMLREIRCVTVSFTHRIDSLNILQSYNQYVYVADIDYEFSCGSPVRE